MIMICRRLEGKKINTTINDITMMQVNHLVVLVIDDIYHIFNQEKRSSSNMWKECAIRSQDKHFYLRSFKKI